jgi:very-short-patch-repair endonuclease
MSRFNRTPEKTTLSRRLRRDGTDVERRLWHRLRNGQVCDAQFRRQHPAGRYVLDFYCPPSLSPSNSTAPTRLGRNA